MLKMSNNEVPQCALQIKQGDKFFSRLLAKESSTANTSCRVYYGLAPGSVPFLWESQPGKPKNPISSTTIPPLTPPPSYLSNVLDKDKSKKQNNQKYYSSIFMAILPKLSMRKTHRHSSSVSSLSSSSFSSAWSFPSSPGRRSCRLPSSRSSCSLKEDEEKDDTPVSPTSILCFRIKRSNGNDSFRRLGDKVSVKKSESSPTLGHGSN